MVKWDELGKRDEGVNKMVEMGLNYVVEGYYNFVATAYRLP